MAGDGVTLSVSRYDAARGVVAEGGNVTISVTEGEPPTARCSSRATPQGFEISLAGACSSRTTMPSALYMSISIGQSCRLPRPRCRSSSSEWPDQARSAFAWRSPVDTRAIS